MSKLYNTKFKPTKVGVIKFVGQKIGSLIKGKGKVSPDIKSVKPSVGKTKHQKELSNIRKEGKKSVGKIKKDHVETMSTIDKARSSLRQNIQRLKGEPVTKSGFSKGKDLREKKMGGGMMGRRMGYSQGKLAETPREKRLAAQYGDKKRITRGDIITIAKKKSGEEPMRDRMKQPLKRKKP
tara:strand:- start:3 stop:545 length:543 start_codon:yes stop_codon:yes gene_type:complete